MTPFGLEVPTAARSALRANLLENGLPANAVDEVADLTVLAASEALNAIDPVGQRASSAKVQVTMVSLSLSLVGNLCHEYVTALSGAANQMGMRVVEAEVSIGAGQ